MIQFLIKLAKIIVGLYALMFFLMLGLVIMTNIMLAGMK